MQYQLLNFGGVTFKFFKVVKAMVISNFTGTMSISILLEQWPNVNQFSVSIFIRTMPNFNFLLNQCATEGVSGKQPHVKKVPVKVLTLAF